MNWIGLAGFLILLLVGNGCRSIGIFDCVMPAISGQVLAADTGKPLAGVKVLRLLPGQSANAGSSAKGAEMLQQAQPETTGADGGFLLSGNEYISFFNRSSYWTSRLVFQAAGFVTLQTNYTSANIWSNLPPPEKLVRIGDIYLQPLKP